MKKGISGKESKLAMLVPFTEKELFTVQINPINTRTDRTTHVQMNGPKLCKNSDLIVRTCVPNRIDVDRTNIRKVKTIVVTRAASLSIFIQCRLLHSATKSSIIIPNPHDGLGHVPSFRSDATII